MLNANALRTGPGEQPADPGSEFATRLRYRLRDNQGLAMTTLREMEPFSALGRCPWAVLRVLVDHLQLNADCWPSRKLIAQKAGYDVRSVHSAVRDLVRLGILRTWRERRPDGRGPTHYAPGFTLLRALEIIFDTRYPKGPARGTRKNSSASTGNEITRAAEIISTEPQALNSKPSSSAPPPSTAAPAPDPQEENLIVTRVEREVATEALVHRHRRKFGSTHPTPLRWNNSAVNLVARCAAAVQGSREEKLRALVDAVNGAWPVSDGPPSITFIFGDEEHFREHWTRGAERATALERERDRRAHPHSHHRPVGLGFEATGHVDVVDSETMSRDLATLFAPWGSTPLKA